MIKPSFAGQFYPDDFGELNKEIEDSFKSDFGPGALPEKRKEKKVFGIVAPHAGYVYSGAAAAWAYKEIAESRFAQTYVILAPDHNGRHLKATTSLETWDMPFGPVKADQGFIKELLSKCDFIEEGRIIEHAIEVQLPFLQFACRDRLKELKIVPLVIPSAIDFEKLAVAINEISEDCCIIASSDFTHYGPSYGYRPFSVAPKERIKKLDNKAIDCILKLDSKRFLKYVKATKATICGQYAIAAAIEIVKEMFAKKGRLLAYYTSGDISKDYTNSVSYAAIDFR